MAYGQNTGLPSGVARHVEFENVPDPVFDISINGQTMISEAHRILAPGGTLRGSLVSEQMRNQLKNAGFTRIRTWDDGLSFSARKPGRRAGGLPAGFDDDLAQPSRRSWASFYANRPTQQQLQRAARGLGP